MQQPHVRILCMPKPQFLPIPNRTRQTFGPTDRQPYECFFARNSRNALLRKCADYLVYLDTYFEPQ